jgi:hypothetical protein
MRRAVVLFAVLVGGCLPLRVGAPPTDRDQFLVRDAIKATAQPSFDRNLRGDGWVARPYSWGSDSCWGQDHWSTVFACSASAEDPKDEVWRLPASEYRGVLTPVRADVLAAVEKTGVEVTWAPSVTSTAGPNPEAQFVIRYLRKNREVAGEVVGRLAPSDKGRDPHDSELRVTLNEWYCK